EGGPFAAIDFGSLVARVAGDGVEPCGQLPREAGADVALHDAPAFALGGVVVRRVPALLPPHAAPHPHSTLCNTPACAPLVRIAGREHSPASVPRFLVS